MTRISGYCPKLLVPHSSGDTNSEHFNTSSMYLYIWYLHAIIRRPTHHRYQNPLPSTASEKRSDCEL